MRKNALLEFGFAPKANLRIVSAPTMASSIIEQIKAAEAAKASALVTLHVELGYEDARALAAAIIAASSVPQIGRGGAAKGLPPAQRGGGRGRRVSDQVRTAIRQALEAGATASHLPEKFGVSYNIVHAIKKEVGMVTARRKRQRPRG